MAVTCIGRERAKSVVQVHGVEAHKSENEEGQESEGKESMSASIHRTFSFEVRIKSMALLLL